MQKSIKLWFVLIIIMSMFHSNITIYQVNYQSNDTHILKYDDENIWGQIEIFFNKIHNLYLIGEQMETEIENNIAQKLKNIATNIEVIKNNNPRKITNICDSTNKCQLVMKIQFQNVTRNFVLVYNFFATQLEVIREQIMIFF